MGLRKLRALWGVSRKYLIPLLDTSIGWSDGAAGTGQGRPARAGAGLGTRKGWTAFPERDRECEKMRQLAGLCGIALWRC